MDDPIQFLNKNIVNFSDYQVSVLCKISDKKQNNQKNSASPENFDICYCVTFNH